uniref:Tail tube B n=1 Tax=uncultured marine virus TaxID=186617 RepID=A0A0F7LCA3_9VIRU|nr:tail tube B [uncultured marine virus]
MERPYGKNVFYYLAWGSFPHRLQIEIYLSSVLIRNRAQFVGWTQAVGQP